MHFVNKRKFTFALSLIVILAGLVSFFVRGMNLGIDFVGGSLLQVDLKTEAAVSEVQEVVAQMNLDKEISIQQSGTEFYIRTQELTQEQTDEMMDLLQAKYPEIHLLSSESVGATVGGELTRNAIISVLIASALMLVYISFRFELGFGIAAIIGVLHNVLVVIGIFSFLQWEITSSFIAAILTVVGYSINDTIVIFDRIREMLKTNRRGNLVELVDKSITATLNRSINTVLTSLLPLIALYIWGGESIKLFIMVMIIGFIVGCYSSIFIASPLWYVLKSSKQAS